MQLEERSSPAPDSALVQLVRDGSRLAADTIVRRHAGLVGRVIRKHNPLPPAVDRDDLFQVGCLALLAACRHWADNGRAKFSTYATACIANAVLDELRQASTVPLAVDPVTLYEREQVEQEAGVNVNGAPAGQIFRLVRAMRPLSKDQRDFLIEVFGVGQGESPAMRATARKLGRSYGTVYARTKRLIDICRKSHQPAGVVTAAAA